MCIRDSNEHHDFPRVPGSRLHKIREIAPEYYDTLKYHTSWTKVIADYILDPGMGPFAPGRCERDKRRSEERTGRTGSKEIKRNAPDGEGSPTRSRALAIRGGPFFSRRIIYRKYHI